MQKEDHCFIIAEAGVNHNGSFDMAHRMVDAAVAAGANAVKFQTFKAEHLVSKTAPKAEYQKKATSTRESQYQMLKRLELTHEHHRELQAYCRRQGIEFMSTAFDLQSLEFIVTELGVEVLKIPSGEITNGPLVLAHARLAGGRCKIILSTGMCSLDEVETALGVIAFGLMHADTDPRGRDQLIEACYSDRGRLALRDKLTLLHCTTEYPAPPEDINLAAMDTLRNQFGLPVGYSDHSDGIAISVAAVARGATVIEKHFTLDKSLQGPDHKASLEPRELAAMVESIRVVEAAIGDGVKQPGASEMKNIEVARKSLFAAADIEAGAVFDADNLTIMRPGTGRSPMDYWDMLGLKSTGAYKKGDLIDE